MNSNVPQLEDLSRVYHAANTHQDSLISCWLKWAFITGLRSSELRTLKHEQMDQPVIRVRAEKTGKLHLIPKHQILNGQFPEGAYPLSQSGETLRSRLKHYCHLAGVDSFTPYMIRRLSATEYERALAGAAGMLLGHSLGDAAFDQVEMLRAAQDRLRIPQAMKGGAA